ncbi:MAG: HAD hydrolase-like protein [Opitutae bacterium]|nr:HAD hydrolase-like protein [Opitutae bacterium]
MNIGFDFDGTLLDSSWRHVMTLRKVWPEVDSCLGDWPLEFLRFKAEGYSTRSYLEGRASQVAEDVNQAWITQIEADDLLKHDRPYEGCFPFLEECSKAHDLYLITARGNASGAQQQFVDMGFERYFQKTRVVAPGRNAGLLKAQCLNGITLDVVVGDTESDLDWAIHAGSLFIPVSWGFRSAAYWSNKNIEAANNYNSLRERVNAAQ